jgi:hypothetical protein
LISQKAWSKFEGFMTRCEQVPGHPEYGYAPPAQSPQMLVFITIVCSPKKFLMVQSSLLKKARGLPHRLGLGDCEVMSAGILLREKK